MASLRNQSNDKHGQIVLKTSLPPSYPSRVKVLTKISTSTLKEKFTLFKWDTQEYHTHTHTEHII